MLTLEKLQEQVNDVESKVESLETILGRFIVETGSILRALERGIDADRRAWRERFDKTEQRWETRFENEKEEWEKRFAQGKQEQEARFVQEKQEREARFAQEKQEREARFAQEKQERIAYFENVEKARIAERREWNKKWGEIANKLGTLVEDIVAPNIRGIAHRYLGIDPIEDFMVRRTVRNKKDRKQEREFDVIVVGADKVIINETKSTPRLSDIDDFVKTLNQLEDYFPEYNNKTIIPVFASLYLPDHIIVYLTNNNIYAMAIGDETMDLLNFDKIQSNPPKAS